MALTDNRTQLQDCQTNAETSGDSDASPVSDTSESGFVIEGAGALQFQITNAQEHLLYDLDLNGNTFSLDLSDSTVYIMVKDNLCNTFANLGGQVCLKDGADGAGGDDIGYNVGGADVAGLPYEKRYHGFKLDVSVVVASPGTNGVDYFTYGGTEAGLNHAAILQVGYGSNHLAKAQGTVPNCWFDGIYYIANGSYAATVTGGTSGAPETMGDLVGDDIAVGAGMFYEPVAGIYYIFAPTEWGDSGTGSSWFFGSDETWVFLGDNGGGHAVGATHFPMRVVANATGTNGFQLTRVTLLNVGTRAQFAFNDANLDTFELDGCVFTNFGAITMPVDGGTSRFANSCIFNNCDQVDLQDLVCDGLIFNGTTDANGAIIWDADDGSEENQDNLEFNSDGTGHAIEIDIDTASATVFNIDGYVFDGYAGQTGTAGNRVFLINNPSDGDITINLTNCEANNVVGGGSGFSFELAAGTASTVTINQTVTLTVTVSDSDGNPIEGARVRIEETSGGALVSQGSTNASGIYTDGSYNFGGALAVTTKVRLKGYRNFRTGGTIQSTGLDVGVTLQRDPIVDLP